MKKNYIVKVSVSEWNGIGWNYENQTIDSYKETRDSDTIKNEANELEDNLFAGEWDFILNDKEIPADFDKDEQETDRQWQVKWFELDEGGEQVSDEPVAWSTIWESELMAARAAELRKEDEEDAEKWDWNVQLLHAGEDHDTDMGDWAETEGEAFKIARALVPEMEEGDTVQIIRVVPESGDVDDYCYEFRAEDGTVNEYFMDELRWL